MGDPAMTEHLGGPESLEKIAERQANYERLAESGEGRVFKIVDASTGEPAGGVLYWERTWRDKPVYEIGWSVLPRFQGRGVASGAAAQSIAVARSEGKHRFLYAFPSIDNPASNAICRKLGFKFIEECQFEYPAGSFMQCNEWRLDLRDG